MVNTIYIYAGYGKRIFQNVWLRYLDTIFCTWTQGSQKLNEFFNCINSLRPKIKFTMGYSTTEINFLDATATKVGNKLQIHLYRKPTDMHQYLHAQLYQRNMYKKSVAYCQAVNLFNRRKA